MQILPLCNYVVQDMHDFWLWNKNEDILRTFFLTEEIDVCCFGTTGEQTTKIISYCFYFLLFLNTAICSS